MHKSYFLLFSGVICGVLNSIDSNSEFLLSKNKLNVLVRPPFISYDPKSQNFLGIDFLILKLISKQINYGIEFTTTNDSRDFSESDLK